MGVINIISVVCIAHFQINKVINTPMCIGINGTEICCSGYQWNDKGNICIPCEKGNYGFKCEKRCAFPYYGTDCQSQCNCTDTYCHYADGCNQTSETEQTSSHTTSTYENTAKGRVEIKDKEDNPFCPSIHKSASTDKTPMVVGIIVLAAVAFIISLTILFTYQIEKVKG